MFDFAWSELALIGVVALVVIGPKDLPVAIKAVTGAIKKARRMAGEFQTHVDEMVREADLGEVRDTVNQLRNLDLKNEIRKAVDADGSISSALADDPFKAAAPLPEQSVAETPAHDFTPPPEPEWPAPQAPDPAALAVPAFIPPEVASPPVPPAFIPPGAKRA